MIGVGWDVCVLHDVLQQVQSSWLVSFRSRCQLRAALSLMLAFALAFAAFLWVVVFAFVLALAFVGRVLNVWC